MDVTPPRPRDTISPSDLATDIRLCLQMAKGRSRQARLAREAFAAVAEQIVEHFVERGYEVTAPRPEPRGPAPNMSPGRTSR